MGDCFTQVCVAITLLVVQQTGVYAYPLGAGSARPNPKKGAPETENPLFVGFTARRGGMIETVVSDHGLSEGARPWGRGSSEIAK